HTLRSEQLISLDHADGGGGDIVVARLHDTRVLGGFPTEQCCAGLDTTLGDAGDDLGDVLGNNLADGDVVLQEQRLSATADQIIDAHGDQVDADGVVLVHHLGDNELGAHAVGTRGQDRLPVLTQLEQSGETTEVAADLRAGCTLGQWGKQFDGTVTGLDVHAGGCVGYAFRGGTVAGVQVITHRVLRFSCLNLGAAGGCSTKGEKVGTL